MSRNSCAKGPRLRVCAECGGEFYSQRPRRACSNVCSFWRLVDKSAGADACWPYTGSIATDTGYGLVPSQYSPSGRRDLAHRVAYNLHYICDPGLLCVLHRCDNRACANPAHLFLGTKKVNFIDCWKKGRAAYVAPGADNYWSKLSEDSVRAILASDERAVVLAARYHVSRGTVFAIRRGETWRHLRNPVLCAIHPKMATTTTDSSASKKIAGSFPNPHKPLAG